MKRVQFKELVVGDKFKKNRLSTTIFKKISENENDYNAEINGFSDVKHIYKNEEYIWKIEG